MSPFPHFLVTLQITVIWLHISRLQENCSWKWHQRPNCPSNGHFSLFLILILLQYLLLFVCSLTGYSPLVWLIPYSLSLLPSSLSTYYSFIGLPLCSSLKYLSIAFSSLTLCFLSISFVCFNFLVLIKLLQSKHLAQCLVRNSKCSISGSYEISCSIHSLVDSIHNSCYYYYYSTHIHLSLQLYGFSPDFLQHRAYLLWQLIVVLCISFPLYFPTTISLGCYSPLH